MTHAHVTATRGPFVHAARVERFEFGYEALLAMLGKHRPWVIEDSGQMVPPPEHDESDES